MSGFPSFDIIGNMFTAPQPKKSETDDYDPFQDSDDEDSKPSKSANQFDTAMNDIMKNTSILPDLMSGWFADPKVEAEKKQAEKLRMQEEERREFEDEERRNQTAIIAKRRKEEREKYDEQQRLEEETKRQKEMSKSKSFFTAAKKDVPRSSTPDTSLSKKPAAAEAPSSDRYASPPKEQVLEAVAYQQPVDDEVRRRREEQQRLYYEKEQHQQQLRWEADQKRYREVQERRSREEQEHQLRLEHEAHQRELQEFEKLRVEHDMMDKKTRDEQYKKQQELEIKKLKEEQDKERKLREAQTRKIGKLVQKQIDRQELSRQYSNAAKPAISRELIQKITEVQVNEDIDANYQKKKEEEYNKLKAEKIRDAENIEFQKNIPVIGWLVGGIMGNATASTDINPATSSSTPAASSLLPASLLPITPLATMMQPTKFDPYDEKRSPFEKHLTDTGFRVTLHKFKTYDEYYYHEIKEDDDKRVETTLTRKAIIRFDPSFNSLYIDVKVEGNSTIFHYNMVRDIKKLTRGVRATSILRNDQEPPENTKYISLNLSNKLPDVIFEFESVRVANNIYPELSNFITFRKEYPTVEIGAQLHPTSSSLSSTSSGMMLPTILPILQYNSIFEIERAITPKLLNASQKMPPPKTVLLKADTIKGIGSALANTAMFKSNEDDDDDEGTKSKKLTTTRSMRSRLNVCVEWFQWVRVYNNTTGAIIGAPTKYRLLVLASNGRASYYSIKEDTRDDDINPGLEAMKKGLWDEEVSLYDRGFKLEGGFNKGYVSSISPNSTNSEPYMVDIRFIDMLTFTIACDSEAKWQDAVVGIRAFLTKDTIPKSPAGYNMGNA